MSNDSVMESILVLECRFLLACCAFSCSNVSCGQHGPNVSSPRMTVCESFSGFERCLGVP